MRTTKESRAEMALKLKHKDGGCKHCEEVLALIDDAGEGEEAVAKLSKAWEAANKILSSLNPTVRPKDSTVDVLGQVEEEIGKLRKERDSAKNGVVNGWSREIRGGPNEEIESLKDELAKVKIVAEVDARAASYWWRNYFVIQGKPVPCATDESTRRYVEEFDAMAEKCKQFDCMRAALSPVWDWYQPSDEPRDLAAIVSDSVNDLVQDRKEVNQLRQAKSEAVTACEELQAEIDAELKRAAQCELALKNGNGAIEYKVVPTPDMGDVQMALNLYGKDGWVLTGSMIGAMIFQRPAKATP